MNRNSIQAEKEKAQEETGLQLKNFWPERRKLVVGLIFNGLMRAFDRSYAGDVLDGHMYYLSMTTIGYWWKPDGQ